MSIVEEIADFTMRTQATIQQLIKERDAALEQVKVLTMELQAVRKPDSGQVKEHVDGIN